MTLTNEGSDTKPVDVLLVEDNPADVELTERILQGSNYPVNLAVAEDGEVAMDFLRKVGTHTDAPRPDLIILDLNMPRKTGYEVLEETSQDSDLSLIPVLILTSTQAERDRLQYYGVPPNRYFNKPLPIARFNDIVSQLSTPGAAAERPRAPQPGSQPAAQPASRRRWWWPFGR
jgi:CheY-like chemotaxis protein